MFCCNKTDFCNSESAALKRFEKEIATTTEPSNEIAVEVKFQKLQLDPDDENNKDEVQTKKLNDEDEEEQLNAALWRNGSARRGGYVVVPVLLVSCFSAFLV